MDLEQWVGQYRLWLMALLGLLLFGIVRYNRNNITLQGRTWISAKQS